LRHIISLLKIIYESIVVVVVAAAAAAVVVVLVVVVVVVVVVVYYVYNFVSYNCKFYYQISYPIKTMMKKS
jgi:hypothetical protein